jgi:hypothetical protein
LSDTKLTREACLALLAEKQAELTAEGFTRMPQRSDFTDAEVVAVKAFLGPWPRALEAAGLKEPRMEDRIQKNRDKRARAEKRRKRERRAARAEDPDGKEHTEGTGTGNG